MDGGNAVEEKKILPPGAGAEALERLREAGSALLLWMLGRDAAGSLLALGAQALAPAWAASPVVLWLSKVLAGYGVGFPLAVWWLLRRPDPPPERAALHPGRLLRDAVAQEKPYIFTKHVYACASIAGALVCVLGRGILGRLGAMLAGAAAVMLIRFLAVRFRWNLPRIRGFEQTGG